MFKANERHHKLLLGKWTHIDRSGGKRGFGDGVQIAMIPNGFFEMGCQNLGFIGLGWHLPIRLANACVRGA